MTSDEFWSLTIEEYEARCDVYLRVEKRLDERAGVIAAAFVNANSREGAPPIRPGDFFGHSEPVADEEITPEASMLQAQAFAAAFNSRIAAVGVEKLIPKSS